MYTRELKYCPGCRNGCPVDNLTCGVGERLVADHRKREEEKKRRQEEESRKTDTSTFSTTPQVNSESGEELSADEADTATGENTDPQPANEQRTYPRRSKEALPVVAICYDFDRTLSPDDMQAQGYIQAVGFNVNDFWQAAGDLARNNNMDQNLAYMYLMMQEARGNLILNRNALQEYGAKVQLFPGVEDWFERIRAYGQEKGVIVEHYIISSGLKEMIEGTRPAKNGAFEQIYASEFYYDERGEAKWPAQAVNYTNKTQFLFRISKGVLDVNDPGVNDYFDPGQIRVPFRNMIYIGDSDTDIPCMKLVNSYGGHSIGVYDDKTCDKTKVNKMILENRIRYCAPADYTEGAELDRLVKVIIDRTVVNEQLESAFLNCKMEADQDR